MRKIAANPGLITPSDSAQAPTPSDEAWAARIRGGDSQAFERLFRTYYESLWRYARRAVRDEGVAEELVQGVFLRLWAGRTQWTLQGSLVHYLFGATRHAVLNDRRRAWVERQWSEAATHDRAVSGAGERPAEADEQLRTNELMAAVAQAVARLPERRREAYTLRWHHHLTNAQIAGIMGISVKGVEIALTKAMASLRQDLAAFF